MADAAPAIIATSAEFVRIDANFVADRNIFDVTADLCDFTRKFMPENRTSGRWCRSFVPMENMYVRTADAACVNAHENVVFADLPQMFFLNP